MTERQIYKELKVQKFLVRYFVIFKIFAEAELKMVFHHMRGRWKGEEEESSYIVSESFCKLLQKA